MINPKLGWKPDHAGRASHPRYLDHFGKPPGDSLLPTRVDLRAGCGPIKTQFWNNCTGHGITGALEFLELQEIASKNGPQQFGDGKYDPMSALFIYWHERQIQGQTAFDNGAMIVDGIETVKSKGTVRESLWPESVGPLWCPSQACWTEGYAHREFYGLTMENDDMTQVKASLIAGFPVIFGTVLFDSFMNPGPSGLIPVPNLNVEHVVGGHCMLIVGFDDSMGRMIVKNSWGTAWGDKGYCYIPYQNLTPQFASAFWTLRRSGNLIT